MLARDPVKTSNSYGALNGSAPSTSASSERLSTPSGTPGGSSDDKKRRKKKKKKSPSGGSINGDAGLDDADNQDSSENGAQNEAAQLPLPRRLEVAASHADLHAALVGLVGWSRLYVKTDTIMVFFQCDALRLLLVNVLNVRPKADIIFENLTTLLANCLFTERESKSTMSTKEVATAVVSALRAMIQQLPPLSNGESDASSAEDSVVTVEKIAAYLSKLVLGYRLSLTGVALESSISQEVFVIEAQLAAVAAQDSAVKGQAIRDSFQRRDIRSDALTLYETRLAKVVELAQESKTRQHAGTAPQNHGFLSFATEGCDDHFQVDENEVEEMKARMGKLNDEKTAKLATVKARLGSHTEQLAALNREREELEVKLRAVNEQIQDVLTEQEKLMSETVRIDSEFSEAVSLFEDQHRQILQASQQKERREHISSEFDKLERAITQDASSQSESQALLDKHVVCLRQQLEGSVRYFGSELPCVKFMKSRVKESCSEMQKLLQEASGYEALGVPAVAAELKEKADATRSNLEEDTQCVAALKKRDMEVIASMEYILHSPIHEQALRQVDAALKKEALRHIEYVRKVHDGVAEQHAKDSEAKGTV